MSARKANTMSQDHGELGSQLRERRLAMNLSVRELARQLHVSPSLISQIETNKTKPSVSTLYAVVTQLGMSLDELFGQNDVGSDSRPSDTSPPDPKGGANGARELPEIQLPPAPPFPLPEAAAPIEHPHTRKVIQLDSGVRWERLTTTSEPGVDFLYVVYDVGGESGHAGKFQRHHGKEWGYIIRGVLGITVGFDDYELHPGDSIAFDSTTPHRLYNKGDEPVEAVWFVLGRQSMVKYLAD